MVMKHVLSCSVPHHLNEEFFVNALEEGLKEHNILIRDLRLLESAATAHQCNDGRTYRVRVKCERLVNAQSHKKEELSLIIKCTPMRNTMDANTSAHMKEFIKEQLLYGEILPKLELLAQGDRLALRCLYSVKTPLPTVVFMDPKEEGFTVAPLQQELDWTHAALLLQHLAKLHATSMVLFRKEPSLADRYKEHLVRAETIEHHEDFYAQRLRNLLALFNMVVTKWVGYEQIAGNLQYYQSHIPQIAAEQSLPQPHDRIAVLNHGSLLQHNFMFTYKAGEPTKAIFTNFQMSFFGSPACDINFLLNTAIQLELLQQKRSDLIEIYYQRLVETLQRLRYDCIPSLEDLQYELRSKEVYGLLALYGMLSPISTKHETFLNKKGTEEDVCRSRKLWAHFKYALTRIYYLGLLNDF